MKRSFIITIGLLILVFIPLMIGAGKAAVPEPAAMLFFGTGLIGLGSVARNQSKKK